MRPWHSEDGEGNLATMGLWSYATRVVETESRVEFSTSGSCHQNQPDLVVSIVGPADGRTAVWLACAAVTAPYVRLPFPCRLSRLIRFMMKFTMR